MADFTTYRGDAGLGLGGDSSIPAIDGTALNYINQTGRDLMLLNHENNLTLYKQKVADRNKQLELIESGQVTTGEILDKDRPVIDRYQKEVDKEFSAFVKAGGINNKEAYRNYQKKITDLKDAVTHAQYRFAGRKQLEQEMASQPIKTFQDDYAKHIAGQDNKGFYEGIYAPYQHSLTLDVDAIKKNAVITPYEYMADADGKLNPDGTFKVSGTTFDFDKTRKNLVDKYLQNTDDMFHQQQLLSSVSKMGDAKKAQTVEAMNLKIEEYNRDRGYAPNTPQYVNPVELSPNGDIAENPTDFSAKWILAEQSNARTVKRDDKAADRELKKQAEKDKLTIEKGKLGLGYAKLALEKVKFKDEMSLKWYESKQKLKTSEDKGVWVNDQTTSIIKNAKAGKKEESGDYAGQYKTTSKALIDMFTETSKVGSTTIKKKPVAVYINDKNEATPVYKKGDSLEAGEKMTADELKSKIAENQFGKNAQTVLDASNQVLEKTVGGSSLNDNVDQYYDVRNKKEVPKEEKYPLPKGKPETVTQGNYTYTWNTETGKYE